MRVEITIDWQWHKPRPRELTIVPLNNATSGFKVGLAPGIERLETRSGRKGIMLVLQLGSLGAPGMEVCYMKRPAWPNATSISRRGRLGNGHIDAIRLLNSLPTALCIARCVDA